jgi:hypothetical protein
MSDVYLRFEVPRGALRLQFMDEDGGKASLRDECDCEIAIGNSTWHVLAV